MFIKYSCHSANSMVPFPSCIEINFQSMSQKIKYMLNAIQVAMARLPYAEPFQTRAPRVAVLLQKILKASQLEKASIDNI